MKRIIFIFILSVIFFKQKGYAQNVSQDVILICDNQVIVNESPQETEFDNINATCIGEPTASYLTNKVVFYLAYVASGSTLSFEIAPEQNIDFDFGSWLNPDLQNLGIADRGSQNDPTRSNIYTIGLDLNDSDDCEPPGSLGDFIPGKVRYYDVQPGDRVLIAVDRWQSVNSGYTITFGGDALLDCEMVGGTYELCDNDSNGEENFDFTDAYTSIETQYPSSTTVFYDDYSNAVADNGVNTISDSYLAPVGSNILFARIEDSSGVLLNIQWFNFNVISLPVLIEPEPISICNYDGNVTGIFDLTSVETQMTTQGGLNFSYYTTEALAQDGNPSNAIINPSGFISGSGTVYARAVNSADCYDIQAIGLSLIDINVQSSIISKAECDYDNDNSVSFNLYSYLSDLGVNSPGDFDVYFFENEDIANEAYYDQAISDPYNYSLNLGQTSIIYIRIEIGDCFIISEIHLFSYPSFEFNEIEPQIICDTDFDGIYRGDLTAFEEDIVNNPTLYTFDYFASLQNLQDELIISNPENFVFDSLPATIWVKVTNANGCFANVSIDFDISTDIPFTEIDTILLCEGQNGNLNINLSEFQSSISSLTGVVFIWFETFEDAAIQSNPITNPANYLVNSPEGTVYVRLRKRDYCPVIVPVSFNTISSQTYQTTFCIGNESTINLETYLPEVGLDTSENYTIRYFENELAAIDEDANFEISNYQNYVFDSTGINTIYIRIELINCFVVSLIEIHPLEKPSIGLTNSNPIQVCQGLSIDIAATTNGQTINWYASATSSTPIHTGFTFTTPALDSNASYWLDAESEQGCYSERIQVNIEVTPSVTPQFEFSQAYCFNETPEILPQISDNGIEGVWSPNVIQTSIIGQQTYTFLPNAGECAITYEASITILPIPTISTNSTIDICEGTSATLVASTNGTQINWYDDEMSNAIIFSGQNFETPILNQATVYWVESTNLNCISQRIPVSVNIIETPSFSIDNTISICQSTSIILSVETTASIVNWYDSEDATAPIYTGNSFQTNVIDQPTSFWVEVGNSNCFSEREEVLINTIYFVANVPELMSSCDSGQNGSAIFNLDEQIIGITEGLIGSFNVTFYTNYDDAFNGENVIDNSSSYISNGETIYARVDNLDTDCFSIVNFNIQVFAFPNVNTVLYSQCDFNNDEIETVDLLTLNNYISSVLDLDSNYTLSLHESESDGEDNLNSLTSDSILVNEITNSNTEFWVRIKYSLNACYRVINLNIDLEQIFVNSSPLPYVLCESLDDEGLFNNDGVELFDLNFATESLLMINPANYSVVYYGNEADALSASNPILESTYSNYLSPSTTLYAIVTHCDTSSPIPLELMVEPLPEVHLTQDTTVICADSGDHHLIGVNLGNTYDYLWNTGETTPTIEVNQGGTYYVTITSNSDTNNCSYTSNVLVFEESSFTSVVPTILQSEAFSNNSIIKVVFDNDVNTLGYMYQLDNGPFQEGNIFENVSPGLHTITIMNECGSIVIDVFVIGYMKFFTPNGDGYNDYWNVIGINNQVNSIVYIFDRFGKQLSQIKPSSHGWDGTYNGRNLASTDYWFKVLYNDPITGEAKEFSSHFSLKR